VIASFGDKGTEALFHGRKTKEVRGYPHDVRRAALERLDVLNGAASLMDLRSPPGNRLESLSGDLRGYFSIRVNVQWRIIFRWVGSDAHDVKLTDYH